MAAKKKNWTGARELVKPQAARAMAAITKEEEKESEKMIRVNMRFPRELREDLESIAKKKGVSFSSYVRFVLTEKVKEELGESYK